MTATSCSTIFDALHFGDTQPQMGLGEAGEATRAPESQKAAETREELSAALAAVGLQSLRDLIVELGQLQQGAKELEKSAVRSTDSSPTSQAASGTPVKEVSPLPPVSLPSAQMFQQQAQSATPQSGAAAPPAVQPVAIDGKKQRGKRRRQRALPSLFVGSLPSSGAGAQDQDMVRELRQLLSECGKVLQLTVRNGFAFVDYAEPGQAERTAEVLHGSQFRGKKLVARVQSEDNIRLAREAKAKGEYIDTHDDGQPVDGTRQTPIPNAADRQEERRTSGGGSSLCGASCSSSVGPITSVSSSASASAGNSPTHAADGRAMLQQQVSPLRPPVNVALCSPNVAAAKGELPTNVAMTQNPVLARTAPTPGPFGAADAIASIVAAQCAELCHASPALSAHSSLPGDVKCAQWSPAHGVPLQAPAAGIAIPAQTPLQEAEARLRIQMAPGNPAALALPATAAPNAGNMNIQFRTPNHIATPAGAIPLSPAPHLASPTTLYGIPVPASMAGQWSTEC